MNYERYKAIKKISGILIRDIWLIFSGLTEDQDKAYSSGRSKVPLHHKKHLEHLINESTIRVNKLKSDLENILCKKGFIVTVDGLTNNIDCKNKDLEIIFENHGLGFGAEHVFQAYKQGDKKNKTLLIFSSKSGWFIWHSKKLSFVSEGYREYSVNVITEELLFKVFDI